MYTGNKPTSRMTNHNHQQETTYKISFKKRGWKGIPAKKELSCWAHVFYLFFWTIPSTCINPLSRLYFKKKLVFGANNIFSNFHPNQRNLNSVCILRTHFYLKGFKITHEFNFGFNHKFSYSFLVLPLWLWSMSQSSILTVKYNNKSNVK